ncbi:cytochrome P450 family protein [Nonomuraea phyllanthi]|uniref:hypothetical protein n=1 Tax=Nonomuraea phyllanthi TaxID=2219224 RepID=UPI00186AFEEC|nr:hypothetical protein [Nonomuraea phyllanthi]
MRITRRAQAEAVLSDPRYVPPPVRQDAEPGTLAWLRARVSRFSTGPAHAERRARVTGRLATVDPAELRPAARAMTLERGGDWRGVPTAVLGAALGVADTSAVAAAAAGYLSGDESPEADAAVARLLDQAGLPEITLLLQGHAATEALIENALRHAAPGDDVEARLRETLKDDPPLTLTRRLDTRTGDEVTIDLVAANRDPAGGDSPHLTFGHGLRPCPAPAHALALAAGVLDALLDPDLDPDRGHGQSDGWRP